MLSLYGYFTSIRPPSCIIYSTSIRKRTNTKSGKPGKMNNQQSREISMGIGSQVPAGFLLASSLARSGSFAESFFRCFDSTAYQ